MRGNLADRPGLAVTSAGLGFALLNVNRGAAPQRVPSLSRGLVIPQLLAATDLPQALLQFAQIDLARFDPFRLLVVSDAKLAEFVWEGAGEPKIRCESLRTAMFFTSSGLGDGQVEGPRREVFEEYLVHQGLTRDRQDALHRHQWPDRPELSIRMHRPDARTVSYTTLDITPERVALDYHADCASGSLPTWSWSAPRLTATADDNPHDSTP
jgi:hypothetical protein